jgi:NAD(P) transhydrogenase subunit beta
MNTDLLLDLLAKASYLLAAVLFILGLKRMSSPVTARKGIVQAGWGMVLATAITFVAPSTWGAHGIDQVNLGLMVLAIVLSACSGSGARRCPSPTCRRWWRSSTAWAAARPRPSVAGAAQCRYVHRRLRRGGACGAQLPRPHLMLGVTRRADRRGLVLGSVIAWAKLDGRMDKRFTFPAASSSSTSRSSSPRSRSAGRGW